METLKTYHSVNSKNEKASFSISKMEDIYAKRNGKIDAPHRHDFFTVLIIAKAQGQHKIDFNTYELGVQQVFFVSPVHVHQVIEETCSKGFVMTFSTEFLIENGINLSFIESLNLFQEYGQNPPLSPNDIQFKKIEVFANEVYQLYNSNNKMKDLSIGAYLKLLLIECNNVCSIVPIDMNTDITENRILREFKNHVNKDYKTEHSTSYYAEKLNIKPDHLNRTVKSTIDKTAKEYIQSRIITEAKRLLYFSELSTKEIGFELGFNEPANFSAFFKKSTSFSPSTFQKNELNKTN